MSKHWKAVERSIARFFGAERNPLSGSNSKQSSSDSLSKVLYIETKYRKYFSVAKLFRDTEDKAKKEGKLPIVCLKEKNSQGFLVLLKSTDIDKLLKEKELLG